MFKINDKFKIMVPIIIFAVVAILATTILVFLTKDNNKGNNSVDKNKIKEKDIYGIASLVERYTVYELDYEKCDNGNISNIRGLKNKEVENKINEKIKGCKYYIEDIISNTITFIDTSDEVTTYLNIRLDNGEEYNFEDIFLAETNIEQIISNAVNYYYSCMAEQCSMRFYNVDLDDFEKAPSNLDIDEEILRIINLYHSEGIKKFNFNSNIIEFQIGELDLFMLTESVWQDVAIYKRFLKDENIFIDESNLTQYVFTEYCGNKYNGFLLNNLFLEEYNNVGDEIENKFLVELEKQHEQIKNDIVERAKKDKDNIYFMVIYPYANKYENIYANNGIILLYKMSKKDYEVLGGEEFLASIQREGRAGVNFDLSNYNDGEYDVEIDITDLFVKYYKALDKNGKITDNYCYIDEVWYEKNVVEIIFENDQWIEYWIDDDCSLTIY